MNKELPPMAQPQITDEETIEEAREHVQASLTEPNPPVTLPQTSKPSLPKLEANMLDSIKDLVETLAMRVDQMLKLQTEQYARVEGVLEQMNATMGLAQTMIARLDQLQQDEDERIDRLETLATALIKVNQNLSEVVAALVSPAE